MCHTFGGEERADRILLLASGMFLYARIVLDNVVDLINIEEIRRELRALPENLDAA